MLAVQSGHAATATATASLLLQPRDPGREKWDGPRTGVAAAPGLLGLQAAEDLARLEEFVAAAASNAKRVFYDAASPVHPELHRVITRGLARATSSRTCIPEPLRPHLRRTIWKGALASPGRVSRLVVSALLCAAASGVAGSRLPPL